MAMRFLVLGPIEVSQDGQPIPLGYAQLRCMLAVLLVEANHPVSTGRGRKRRTTGGRRRSTPSTSLWQTRADGVVRSVAGLATPSRAFSAPRVSLRAVSPHVRRGGDVVVGAEAEVLQSQRQVAPADAGVGVQADRHGRSGGGRERDALR